MVNVITSTGAQKTGIPGVAGKSAYQIWLDNGNVGTEIDFLASLVGSSGARFVFTQGVPLSVWSINHALGFNPVVVVTDSADSIVIGDVHYVDINNLTITFVGGFSGKAYLN